MEVLHESCAGLDVHKKTVMACVRTLGPGGRAKSVVKEFGTMSDELAALSAWLSAQGVTHVAMESTGVYWKPVWNALEDGFSLLLCNAHDIRQVPGKKTDVKDCQWIAKLLQHGLLHGSFIPPRWQRQLRDLTRTRAKLVHQKTAHINRLHKILEDANLKLDSVISDVMGASGRAMIEALIAGETDPKTLAELARKRMRGKIPQIRRALEGTFNGHHQFMLRLEYDEIRHCEATISAIDERITELTRSRRHAEIPPDLELPLFPEAGDEPDGDEPDGPGGGGGTTLAGADRAPDGFAVAVDALDEIPGIDVQTAVAALAEIGIDMSRFPSAAHLASWIGVSPPANKSAGKQKRGSTTRRGNSHARTALTQAAWAASRTKDSYFQAQYRRLCTRKGTRRAIVAVANSMVTVIYELLRHGVAYRDLGADFFDRQDTKRKARYHLARLQALGVEVQPTDTDAA